VKAWVLGVVLSLFLVSASASEVKAYVLFVCEGSPWSLRILLEGEKSLVVYMGPEHTVELMLERLKKYRPDIWELVKDRTYTIISTCSII